MSFSKVVNSPQPSAGAIRIRASYRVSIRSAAFLACTSMASLARAQTGDTHWEDAPPRATEAAPASESPLPQANAGSPPRTPVVVTTPAPARIASSGPVRRSVELVPELSLTRAHCAAGDTSSDRCSGVKAGAELGFQAFWRVTPYLAWGGGFELAGFRNSPPAHTGITDAGAGAAFLGLLGRAYFLDRSSIDPYVQLGLGGAVVVTTGRRDNVHFDETGAGPALQLGGGVDFFVSSRVKLGPSLAYTHVFIHRLRDCSGDGSDACMDVSKSDGHLDAFVMLGVRLSVLLGGDM
jgi:opacity protein-like surface antigen